MRHDRYPYGVASLPAIAVSFDLEYFFVDQTYGYNKVFHISVLMSLGDQLRRSSSVPFVSSCFPQGLR